MVLNLNDDGLAANYSALADGWLQPNGTAWGNASQALSFSHSVVVRSCLYISLPLHYAILCISGSSVCVHVSALEMMFAVNVECSIAQ